MSLPEQAGLLRLWVRSTQSWPRAMGIIDKVVSGALIVRLTRGTALRSVGLKRNASFLWDASHRLGFKAFHLGGLQQLVNPYGMGQKKKKVTVCLQSEEQIKLFKLPHLIPLEGYSLTV